VKGPGIAQAGGKSGMNKKNNKIKMDENKKKAVLIFILVIAVITFLVLVFLIWGKISKENPGVKSEPVLNEETQEQNIQVTREEAQKIINNSEAENTTQINNNDEKNTAPVVSKEEATKILNEPKTSSKTTDPDEENAGISKQDAVNILNK
jgi:flagellar basal body-associated protein FliL